MEPFGNGYDPVGSRTDQRLRSLERCTGDMKKELSDMRVETTRDTTEIKQGIEYIKVALDDQKKCQDSLNICISSLNIELAKLPSTQSLNDAIDSTKTHKTYFAMIGASLVMIVGWISQWNPFK